MYAQPFTGTYRQAVQLNCVCFQQAAQWQRLHIDGSSAHYYAHLTQTVSFHVRCFFTCAACFDLFSCHTS